jgi:alpha-1,3-rhamnosyltransferase
MFTDHEPLVSIIVVTYNSSKYILETLESTKNQTYKNIELIISDDCSTDSTLDICNNWLAENKSRFINTKLLSIPKNTGTAANCNRGLFSAKGVWVKYIAGDDILLNNCVQINVSAVNNDDTIQVLYSKVRHFKVESSEKIYLCDEPNDIDKKIFGLDAKDQQKVLFQRNFNWLSQSFFINRNTLTNLNGFDERFFLLEDYPMSLKLTKNNIQLTYHNELTVLYRKDISVSHPDNKWINENYFSSLKKFFLTELKSGLKKTNKSLAIKKNHYLLKNNILIYVFGNKINIFSKVFVRLFDVFFKNVSI